MADEMQWSGSANVIDEMATSPISSGCPKTADQVQLKMLLTEQPMSLSVEAHYRPSNSMEYSGSSASQTAPGADSQSSCSDGDTSSIDEDSECVPDIPLGYARFFGLCHDYQKDYLFDSELIPLEPQPNEGGPSIHDELNSYLASYESPRDEAEKSLTENLDVTEETVEFLKSVAKLGRAEPDGWRAQRTGLRKLKIDLPVLSSDHELAMLKIRKRNTVRLSSEGLVPFKLDIEAGEGPHFPAWRFREKEDLEQEIIGEKLDVDEETMEYLRDVHKLLAGKTRDVAGEAYRQYKKQTSVHVTPPPRPISPPYSPGMPASEAMQIELTSTPEDLIARDAAAAEQQILQEDEVAFSRSQHSQTTDKVVPKSFTLERLDYSPLESIMATSAPTSPSERKRMRNLKLDSPLIPRKSEESPPKKAKRVAFPAEVVDLLPQPSTDSSNPGLEEAREELDAFVEKIVMPFAQSVMHEARNEELIEIDTTMRVPIPPIAAIQTEAPWQQYASRSKAISQLQSQRTFLRYTREETLRGEQRWSGVSKLQRLLPWVPFPPYHGKVDLNEEFDDGSLARYLKELDIDSEVDILALIGRRDRLRLLDSSESDDDEIEPISVTPTDEEAINYELTQDESASADTRVAPTSCKPHNAVLPMSKVPDMLTLLRKKQQELANGPAECSTNGHLGISAQGTTVQSALKPTSFTDLMKGNGLSHFMQLQGTAVGDLRPDSKPLAGMAASVAPPAVMVSQPNKPREEIMPLPAPQLNTSKDARIPIVVSSAVISHRALLRALQTALPNAELVERVALETLGQHGSLVLHAEADFTFSPSTGLINTTLQKLKQKPLPGQANFTGIRDHILAVSARYERLIVLVSEASTSLANKELELRPIDDRDCEALTDLVAFSSSLQPEVQVVYIAGNQSELMQWIAAAVTTHGLADGSIDVLQQETLWERFLRRAGMNPIAAQAILNRLREPTSDSKYPGSSSESSGLPTKGRYGLAAFVMMSASERIRQFGALLGGEHVLHRVNAVLEDSWNKGGI